MILKECSARADGVWTDPDTGEATPIVRSQVVVLTERQFQANQGKFDFIAQREAPDPAEQVPEPAAALTDEPEALPEPAPTKTAPRRPSRRKS